MKSSKSVSKQPTTIDFKVGFFGTGSRRGYGNIDFARLSDWAGIPSCNRYNQNAGLRALTDFFKAIDRNRNRRVGADEANSIIVEVYGYSWGAIAAIGFCQKLSRIGNVVVGGSPRNPIQFQLDAPIRVRKLLTIDPVPLLNPPGTVPSSVDLFTTYYQTNGGDGVLRNARDHSLILNKLGSKLSRLLKGTKVHSQAQQTTSYNIGKDDMSASDQSFFAYGSETNHDTIVWFARSHLLNQTREK